MRYIEYFVIWICGCVVLSSLVGMVAHWSEFPPMVLGFATGILWAYWLRSQYNGE